ncbi:S-layer homology domain-containing protein [Paenibacillus catalpae]|uniref:S-layer homology domain-containing protein n=1 Tax=Paenibacillus catalpae TaxID=1045775 RepID=A0A1I2A9U6_9BACL|nr:S-layer homology domain-containing protein [Paenibacillus catalpae]SFE40616.1 S-layer homology domain-containing protein [Paenibacillus catalpae]
MITNRNGIKVRAGVARLLVMLMIFSSVGFIGLPSVSAAEDDTDVAAITLGAEPVESGISGRAGDNGDGLLTGTEADVPYWQTNKAEGTTYLYMNVSDDYLFDSADYNVDVTLRYFDEGSGSLLLQYDAQSAAFKDSAKFTYGDTKTWKDYTFNLTDAKFANRTNDTDFRIAVEGGGIDGGLNPDLKVASVTVKKTLKETASPEASITLGETPVSHGITAQPGDGAAENLLTGEIGGKTYWKTNQTISPTDHGANILYFYFNVSDSFLFDNSDQDVFVTVEYYDSGSGSMKLQYDAQSAAFKDAPEFTYTNTNTWKKHTFKLGDAKFANGTNGGDFRLHVSGPGAIGGNPDLYIASVSVKTQPQQNVSTETKVYDTVYPTDDVVIADMSVKDFGAAGDGVKDDTKAFQDALAAAGNRGGGVVFAPAGTYKLTSHLIVPTGVTLRGDWISPDASGGEVKGTILAVYADKGADNGPSFLQLAPVSGVTNLSVWYPEQSLSTPVAYPWTFEQLSGDSMTIKNVTLVNSYNGIKIGPSWNELHYVRNLYGTALKTGIFLDYTTDIGRIEHVRLSSSYWAESSLAGSPQQAELKAYTTANTEGIVMGRSDWEYMSDIDLADFKTGMRITTRTGSLETANAQLYKIHVHDSNVALKVEGVNDFGLLISDSSFKANVGTEPKAVYATEGFHSIVQFNKVTFGGTPHHAVVNEGSGVLSFENSTFENWDDQGGGYAIDAKHGSLILGQSSFAKASKHVLLEDSVATVNAVNSGNNGSLAVTNNSDAAELNVHQDAKYVLEQLPEVAALDLENRPRPANDSLFDVTAAPYEADSTGETDVSAKIQQALDDADAAGGGTVYLPAGIYRVNDSLTVPSGVELRGSWDVPHHTIGGGTALFTNHGENDPDGVPFLTLEQDAGLRGLSVYYDEQSWTNVKPYAWTVQGKGSGVYLIDTTLINPYKGVDFGSYDTSGHYIDYVAGSPLMEGIFLGGGAEGGLMRNVQFNPHYYGRNNFPNHPTTDQDFDAVWSYQKENLDAFRIGDVTSETIFNTFVYGSKYGIHFEEQDGAGPEAVVIGHGTDGSKKGAVLDAAGAAGLKLINTELVSMSTSDKVYVVVGEDFDSKAVFFNSSMWGDTTRSFDIFGGDVRIQQSNFTRVGQRGINAVGGDITLYDSYFQQPNTNHVYAGPDIEKLVIANNLFKGGLQLVNEAGTKVTGSNLVPVALDLVKGEFDESHPANSNVALKLTNMTESDPLAGKIEVIAPDSYKDKFVPVRFNHIALGESVTVTLPYLSGDTLKYKVTLDNGYSYVTQVKTAQSFATRKDEDSQVQPLIDISSSTNYSSLGGIWGGKDDLSAEAGVRWDDDNLYVTVRATDNTHYQTWTNGDIWQGDSLQLGIDLSRKDGSASQNVNELGFALTNSGTVSKWRWRAPAGVAAGAFNAADAVITRDEAAHATVYEITLPISELHGAGYTFSQEDPLGLTILLNEHDGAGRSGFIEYNQGIGTSKDATQFGDLYLLSSEYESLLEQSAEAAVAAAEQSKDVASIDAAANFVSLLPQGTVKSGLTSRLAALGGTTNPGSGSGNGSGSGQTAEPKVTVKPDGSVQVDGTPTLGTGTNDAKLSLTGTLLGQAFSKAAANQDGKKKVTIVLPAVTGAGGYALELPASYVNQQSPDKLIELVTPSGTMLLSSDMLKPDADKLGQTVTIRMGSANTSSWSDELKKKIGERPVVDLSVQSSGQTIDWHNSQSPVTVSIPYSPSAAEKADAKKLTVWYIDGSGKPFPVPSGQYKEALGSIVFTAKHFSQYATIFVQKPFSDLNGYDWAKEAIEVLAAKGIINGVSDTSFAPGASIKRADFVKLLVDTLGLTSDAEGSFADVKADRYYADAVGIAKALGITNGAGGNRFNPAAPITREEAATFIERSLAAAKAGLPSGSEDVLAGFADAGDISAYAKSSLSALVKAGLVQGHDGLLEPKGKLTRAEAAVLFYRIYNR